MRIHVFQTAQQMGADAAQLVAKCLNEAISARGNARLVLSTGASQFEMLDALVRQQVAWGRVTMFHLDEYVGLSQMHPASFRRYLKDRFVEKVALRDAVFVDGEGDVEKNIETLTLRLREAPIDVAAIGIGENAHIAFNDPPADFETEEPYLIINLDERCRRQQLGEGWFPSLDAVPKRAASMSIRQILKSRAIVNTVPDQRKAEAVKGALEGKVSNLCPASVLQTHPKCFTFLDRDSASLLTGKY